MILGQVSQITRYDIALALPNNLTGYVPITAISDQLTEKIERYASRINDEAESQDSLIDKDVNLGGLFAIGQYLRACVISTGEEISATQGVKGKRRIELSINPRQVNRGLSKSDLVAYSMVQGSIASIEDHGLVMDLGLADPLAKGFISTKELGSGIQLSSLEPGAVLMCIVSGQSSKGKVFKLSADMHKAGDIRTSRFLSDAPTVDCIVPGTAVEILLAEVTHSGIAGKVMGLLDVTADLFHSGATVKGTELEETLKPGQKIKGRIICTFPTAEPRKLGVSLLSHVRSLTSPKAMIDKERIDPLQALPLSTIVEEATVTKVIGSIGLLVDLSIKEIQGFVHISAISDKRIESLSDSIGPYKLGSRHRARITGYNSMDNLYIVSMEERVLGQPFLRYEDVKIGEVVKGKVEKLVVNEAGVGGLLVNLAEGITGLVPEMHMTDIKLSRPERKFKEGMPVTTRVLSTSPEKRQLRLTLKKSLVNSDSLVFASYEDILPDMQSPGTIVNIIPSGAVVQFYGPVRAFLPVSEMSEAYIEDPTKHFRLGQVVNVRVLSVDPTNNKMAVSCKDRLLFTPEQQSALNDLKIGSFVNGTVTEKSNDDIKVQLDGSQLSAILRVSHLTDGSERKNLRSFKEIRVGQTLKDLIVWDKLVSKRLITLTNKPSLRTAAMNGTSLSSFEDVREGLKVNGVVKNINLTGVFVQFLGGLTGLILKKYLPEDSIKLPDFGLRLGQSITTTVLSVDHGQQRFRLIMQDPGDVGSKSEAAGTDTVSPSNPGVINPVDTNITSFDDLSIGRLTRARIVSIKSTQINVRLADNVQGRVDVSEVFDSWQEISDKMRPLRKFQTKEIISVRILGLHDARNHRFLPITHRTGKNPVYELSAKASNQTTSDLNILSLDKVTTGSNWLAYINNIEDDHVWANISPNVRGRIRLLDLSDEASLLNNVEQHFPVGSALRVHVTNVDVENNRLDLSALSAKSSETDSFETLSQGMLIPGRVTKVADRYIIVQLSETVTGTVGLTDISDDYDEMSLSTFNKNEFVRVCITELDASNRKITLSMRPSKVLNSALPVRDPEILSLSRLHVNDVVRGFVKNVADNGLFVTIGSHITAYVRISDLSDAFIKDWKSKFEVNQLVRGKILAVDPLLNHVQMSLKSSALDKDYIPPVTFNDLQVGRIITGKIRKVEDFGAFIVVDGSANVSGLCHRSEIAEQRVEDVTKLYQEGDVVKAKVLKIEPEKRRINFGLKASYFQDVDAIEDGDGNDAEGGIALDESSEAKDIEDVDMEDGQVVVNEIQVTDDAEHGNESRSRDLEASLDVVQETSARGLQTTGFDWTADTVDVATGETVGGTEEDVEDKKSKKKRKRKAEITVDRTGDLDAHEPQSVADFERLLLGEPDSSYLWIRYMAHQLQLSEISKAREIGERALRTISIREETEKLNVWIALLNLENTYGSDETIEEVFRRACQFNDAQDIYERLTSIYIQSGKYDVSALDFHTPFEFEDINSVIVASGCTLPKRPSEVLSITCLLAQLCHLSHDHHCRTRASPSSATSCHTSPSSVHPPGRRL